MLQEFKSFREQAELMLQRGISGSVEQSKDDLIKELERNLRFINYYRLSAYWYPFRQTRIEKGVTITESSVIPGTKWIDVRNLYMFDRRLRQLIFDAIARIDNVILQTVAPNSQWGERVVDLIQKTNIAGIMIPKAIGFNSSLWYQHPLWNIATVKQTANHVQ
ncbi:MAG: Abi family protein [Akkermansia sp.]|nr:Abi family protein [Akkermansia sp.]